MRQGGMRYPLLPAALGALLICGACGGSPAGPGSRELVALSIGSLGPQAIVGQTTQLTALGIYSDGSTSAVPVSWSVTPASVAVVSDSGSLTALRLGKATVSALHSTGLTAAVRVDVVRDPAISIAASASLAGVWEGNYVVDVCQRVSGDGPSTCRFILGSSRAIRLELSEGDGGLTGRLTLDDDITGDVTGWQDAFTQHVLFGRLASEGDHGPRTFELTTWDASAPDGEIAGAFEGVERFTASATGPQVYLRGGTFVGFRRR